jgi:hypothetical protein
MNENMNEGKERTKRREKYEKTGITEGMKRSVREKLKKQGANRRKMKGVRKGEYNKVIMQSIRNQTL